MQTSSPQARALPLDLWAHVLKHLDTRSRLTARLVCKAFAVLGPADTICITSSLTSEDQYFSIVRFCTAISARGPRAPICDFKATKPAVPHGDTIPALLNPFLCASIFLIRLRSLHLQAIKFRAIEAEMLLLLVPTCLEILFLHTDIEIVANSIWGRLQGLRTLTLFVQNPSNIGENHAIPATGLAQLSLLQALYLNHAAKAPIPSDNPSIHSRCISFAGLTMPKLLRLGIKWDALRDFDPAVSTPSLISLSLTLGCFVFPLWVLKRPFKILSCENWNAALYNHAPNLLQCKVLDVLLMRTVKKEQVISMEALLKLPKLQELHALNSPAAGDLHDALILLGSRESFAALQAKLRFKFDSNADVRVRFHGSPRTASVSECGHPLLCRCVACQ